MQSIKRFFCSLLFCCFSTIFLVCMAAGQTYARPPDKQKVTIAIVRDGPSTHFDPISMMVVRELEQFVGTDFDLVIKDDPTFNAQWVVEKVPHALKTALQDPEVDIIYTAGVLGTRAAAKTARLNKPVVGFVLQEDVAFGLPITEQGRSSKANLVFMVVPQNVSRDIETLQNLVGMRTLHILADAKIIQGVEHIKTYINFIERERKIKIRLIPVAGSANKALAGLDDEAEAVYLTPLHRISSTELQSLIRGINAKKIPSFALLGHPLVKKGVLAGLMPEMKQRWARRIALNIQQIILGVSPNALNVNMVAPDELLINAETAAGIGFALDFRWAFDAKYIGQWPFGKGVTLSLEDAMKMAAEKNVDLAIETSVVESSFQAKQKAKSFLVPQISGNSNYSRIDTDRAKASLGSLPKGVVTAGVTVSQMIFNDLTITGYRTAKLRYEGELFNKESIRLDIQEQTGKIFLQSLSALALLRIERDNLTLTQENLELARIRRQIGVAGPEEIYRWEAEEARQKNAVIAARQSVNRAFVTLNQSLGVDQNLRWQTEDILLNADDFYFLDKRFSELMQNLGVWELFRRFSVALALENSPEIKLIGKNIEARRLTLNRLRRRFYLPSLQADFVYDYNIDEDFEGEDISRILPGAPPDDSDDHEWAFSVKLTIPLYEGGGRLDDLRQATADLRQLMSSRERIRQLLEQRVQSAVFTILESHPNIFLSRKAADRAGKNLDVVQDKYAKGKTSIIDLIDAQNNKLSQDQAAAIAVYQFLSDMIEYQRAISWFEFTKTAEERTNWFSRFETSIQENRGR